jgi:hypothetical protein
MTKLLWLQQRIQLAAKANSGLYSPPEETKEGNWIEREDKVSNPIAKARGLWKGYHDVSIDYRAI